MDNPNAFIGQIDQPTAAAVTSALGETANLWQQLIDWLAQKESVSEQEWKSISPKYGWSLRMKSKKRTIVYLTPSNGCFLASFVLGPRAIEAAKESSLPEKVVKAIEGAHRYAEGTGIRLIVKESKDLATIRTLVQIKLAN